MLMNGRASGSWGCSPSNSYAEGVVMEPARISGHRLDPRSRVAIDRLRRTAVSRRLFIVGSGLIALILVVSPRWGAQRRSGIYSDTYFSVY